MTDRLALVVLAVLGLTGRAAEVSWPRVADPELRLELLAAEPEIVTPIGCAVDAHGRIFVVESHTHFPKEDYSGPASDRVKVFRGRVGEKPAVFAEGFRWAMNLTFGPDQQLYLTHRNGVIRFAGPDANDRATGQKEVVVLETAATYPHNGLGGIAFGPDGWLYLGTGENLGLAATLRGSDGSQILLPAGAGGMIARCRPDGTKLELWATGFWNPFGLAFDARGRLFMVDNDPDSRPPCRLVRVIQGGNYGFQFRHGRDGLSPFIAWNGELPGTLGMVAGTGEAPTSLLDAAQTRFPARYDATLFVAASWEHRIEAFRPTPVGASFRAGLEVVMEGDADFRPVGLAATPEGSVVFTDWVKSDYNVHRHGRLWKLSARNPTPTPRQSLPEPSSAEQELNALLLSDPDADFPRLRGAAGADDPFLRSAAITRLSLLPAGRLATAVTNTSSRIRAGLLLAARQSLARTNSSSSAELSTSLVRQALKDPDAEVRLVGVVWAAEEKMQAVAPDMARALDGLTPSPLLVEAQSAGLQVLKNTNAAPLVMAAGATQVRSFNVSTRDTDRTAQALALVRDVAGAPFLRLEAVRDLAGATDPAAVATLQDLARDPRQPGELRAEAILSLTGTHHDGVTSLLPLLRDPAPEVQVELVRALRPWAAQPAVKSALEGMVTTENVRAAEAARLALGRPEKRPKTAAEWTTVLGAASGDPVSGRRVFYSPTAGCAKCHRIEGRGGLLGPSLSTISRAANRERLLASILEPSRDIAPQFADHHVETTDGEVYTGRLAAEGPDGSVTLMNGEGTVTQIPARLIRSNQPSALSLMPEGLADALTLSEMRDLMAFLETCR